MVDAFISKFKLFSFLMGWHVAVMCFNTHIIRTGSFIEHQALTSTSSLITCLLDKKVIW